MKKLIFLLLPLLVPLKAGALELLLEENRGESGTIGYVDIDRVFKEYSGTTGARDEFIAEIRKKEDELNLKKTALFTLKAEIAKLQQEREFALTLPSLLETQRSVLDAAAAAAQAVQPSTQAVQSSTQAAQPQSPAAQSSLQGIQTSTQAAPPPPPSSAMFPAAAAITSSAPPALPPGVTAMPGMDGIDMPGISKVPVSHFKFSVSTSVPEIDAVLTRKEADLKNKEEELRQAQKQDEKDLLDYESRKSELLLGRIYVALKELAVKEEVSVIVDKRNILYGQNAVDLTGKLLKKLEENGL